jgi:hypothetical protein
MNRLMEGVIAEVMAETGAVVVSVIKSAFGSVLKGAVILRINVKLLVCRLKN